MRTESPRFMGEKNLGPPRNIRKFKDTNQKTPCCCWAKGDRRGREGETTGEEGAKAFKT